MDEFLKKKFNLIKRAFLGTHIIYKKMENLLWEHPASFVGSAPLPPRTPPIKFKQDIFKIF